MNAAPRIVRRAWYRSLILLALIVTSSPSFAQEAPRSPTPNDVPLAARVTDVAVGLEHPWGLAFLPDGRLLVTERPGRLRLVTRDGVVSPPFDGVPPVLAGVQGGLLDVTLSPHFTQDQLVYLAFAEADAGGGSTAVARGRLGAQGLEHTQVVWRQQPKVRGDGHWGARLVWRPDGTLFVTLGDRSGYRELVQDMSTTIGKIVRINPDGSIPSDNPFVSRTGVRPEIWSLGHRNIQAAVLDSKGDLWTVEHGARGGDELNRPEPGKNYGWPVISCGVPYSGARIGIGTAAPGMEQPIYYWDPVIAPSGAVFYSGTAFPDWRGDLFVGSLQPGRLVRLRIRDGRVEHEERYRIGAAERIRDVREGPDGFLYLLTDHQRGRIARVQP